MAFIIATAVLLLTSSVYLLHEYWSGALAPDESPDASSSDEREATPAETLRAA
jgi:hypothetical protein